MPVFTVELLGDPRIAPYRLLKDRELARDGRRFIAEGEHVVRRLLDSDFAVESVLLARRRADEVAPIVRPEVPVYVVPDPLVHEIIGFKFHSGVIACGVRKPPMTLDEIVPHEHRRLTLVACPEIANVENLGAMIRISAGFGADAMLLGERCADPFFRQAIRVSMGTVFRLPLLHSNDLMRELGMLKRDRGVEMIASVLDENAEPLSNVTRADRVCVLFGNEAQGLPRPFIDVCDRRVTIPMKLGTDSLNVAVAAGVFLYHFTR